MKEAPESQYDLVDEHDNMLGRTAAYTEVHRAGLWHRGVHVIVYTPDGRVVMQKRAPTLAYHPNEVEISVGGGVDAGETTEQAAIREVKEELGVTLQPKELRFLGKTVYSHRSRSHVNRTHIYSYSVCVDPSRLRFVVNPRETTAAFMISKRGLKTALRMHRIKNIGRITSQYAYWRHMLDAVP
ncbi:MAG TPA: NUDIX domain-containing protein [Candidatus Saccharimonadales bacterium]|nr:NUDIX domain-containing protein [Candidatus Saccharimonadales bacterium]